MASQQSKNRRRGERFERTVLDKIAGSCAFAARVSETSNDHSTPDLVCVQDESKGLKGVTRLIEAKYNGYIKPDQREELKEIVEKAPDDLRVEVWHKTSPRKQKKRTIAKEGWSPEKTEEILEEEFSSVKFDRKQWEKENSS